MTYKDALELSYTTRARESDPRGYRDGNTSAAAGIHFRHDNDSTHELQYQCIASRTRIASSDWPRIVTSYLRYHCIWNADNAYSIILTIWYSVFVNRPRDWVYICIDTILLCRHRYITNDCEIYLVLWEK